VDAIEQIQAILSAARFAAEKHANQRRKGKVGEPYINHLLEVASLVTQATGGTDPDAVIAALLHDAIEDQGVPAETIAGEFGERVADLVFSPMIEDQTKSALGVVLADQYRRVVENGTAQFAAIQQ